MALTYTGTGGIFTVLGKYFHAMNTLNTARRVTVYDEVQDAIDAYKAKTDADLAFDLAVNRVPQAEQSWRSAGSSLVSALASDCQGFLRQSVRADSLNNRLGLVESLQYLLAAMLTDDRYVDPSAASVAVAVVAGGSATDLVLIATDVGKMGTQLDHIFAEVIRVECTTGGESAVLDFLGERAATSKLVENWPAGSGVNSNLSPLSIDDSLLTNGDFEAWTNTNLPDNWIPSVGSPTTDFRRTNVEVQTVTISGTPTAGTYHLRYTDPATSLVHATDPLPFNATAAQVQSALRTLPGLSAVTVTSTGSSPNFEHTVTFVGLAGNLAQLTSVDNSSPGSIAHATVTNGDAQGIQGYGLFLTSLGTTVTLHQRVSLEPRVVYAVCLWFHQSNSDGVSVTISLRNGIGGSLVTDDAGNNQTIVGSISTASRTTVKGFFRVSPAAPTDNLYLEIAISVGEPTNTGVIDNVILAPATQLYPGGPFVAMFPGKTPPALADKWTVTAANDYGGEFQERFNQVFPMAENGLLLRTAGTTNIPDSLIG